MDGGPSAGAKLGNAETGITLGERGLELPLPDGTRGYFNYYWLRDNCATSFDRETRERTYDIFQDSEPRPAGAHSDGEALEIVWHGRSDEHTSELQSLMRTSYAAFRLQT